MNDEVFIHEKALVAEGCEIGPRTRIWAFSNILKGARIGADCNICDHCFIEGRVRIGDRVTVKNGVSLWDGLSVENDVFIGPHAVFTNDVYPRSRVYHDEPVRTKLKMGCTIGANATIIAGHTIGCYAFVGAGAVVTRDVPDHTLWLGNPARQVGYVCRCGKHLKPIDGSDELVCSCGLKYHFDNGVLTLPEW
ncbi:MAG TPA: acyltransferase [candidate division Zixibacteria bacterium]|nr:acyltransferase [candidate division Zixibacteria bacterium]